MHSNRYTIFFTMLTTMILAFVLSSVYSSLEEQTERNVQADIKKNILSSLGFTPSEDMPWTTDNVEKIFKTSITSFVIDETGSVIPDMLPEDIDPKVDTDAYPLYKKMIDGKVDGFAIPISGKGLWGTMYGYFAIEPDGATAKGITFYKHVETPGLGAEVDKPWFQQNYKGKKFIDDDGVLVGIQTVKGKVDQSSPEAYHQVDGISGATITSRGLNEFLLKDLKICDSYLKQIRKNFNS